MEADFDALGARRLQAIALDLLESAPVARLRLTVVVESRDRLSVTVCVPDSTVFSLFRGHGCRVLTDLSLALLLVVSLSRGPAWYKELRRTEQSWVALDYKARYEYSCVITTRKKAPTAARTLASYANFRQHI